MAYDHKAAKRRYEKSAKGKAAVKRYQQSAKGQQKFRRAHIKHAYGITEEEHYALVQRQEGRCGICSRIAEVLCVDHCHTTKIIRGLLCHGCNKGLGHFRDDAELLEAAALYLRISRL